MSDYQQRFYCLCPMHIICFKYIISQKLLVIFNRFSSNNSKVSIYTCITNRLKVINKLFSNNHNCFTQVTVNPHFWPYHCENICFYQSHLCTSDLIFKIFFGNTKFRRISEFFVQELLIALGVIRWKMWFYFVSVLINNWIKFFGVFQT